MTKAKSREEFIKAWESEFDVLAGLSESLPMQTKPLSEGGNIALNYLSELRKLRLKYIALAANEVYGVRLCRYCERMKDHADGQTGANAPGSHCELELVKPETGDLTAAFCPKYGNWETVLARRKEQEATQDPTLNPKFLGKMAKNDPL